MTVDAATAGAQGAPASASVLRWAPRPRDVVRAAGPDAEAYLNRMLSNDVAQVPVKGSQDALLLTAKARVIAPVRLVRRAVDEFLLLTEPGLGAELARQLLRARFAAKVEIAAEPHEVTLVLAGAGTGAGPAAGAGWEPPAGVLAAECPDYGVPGWELVDAAPPEGAAGPVPADELERLRIRARTARFGLEIDDRVMPAEAGLVDRTISFSKGCYPGQEPVARLHYRGHANRGLRALAVPLAPGAALPAPDTPVLHEGKEVGRVTSAVEAGEAARAGGAPAEALLLAYVRVEVPEDAPLDVAGAAARQLG